jgi:hypothetical protein
MADELVQVTLHSGPTVCTCWVPARVREGNQVTLKDGADHSRLWTVMRVWPGRRTAAEIPRGWHNNI